MSAGEVETAAPALFLDDSVVAEVTDLGQAIGALRDAYSRPELPNSTPERVVASTSAGWLRVMPSAPSGARLAGHKTISGAVRNGLVSYLIALFDQERSNLVALVDGNRITGIRTAATAAVAIDAIASPGPLSIGVIGSGFEARAQLHAAALVRGIREVRVFSPTPANREAFARDLFGELGVPVTPVESAHAAAAGAELILCAARSRDESPTLTASDVADGATIVSVGSTAPSQRELDVELVRAAGLIVADTWGEVVNDSGDMIAARAAGVDVERTVSLAAVLGGEAPVRDPAAIAIYKSTGSGFQDIVIAELLYERARARGLGYELPVGILTIRK